MTALGTDFIRQNEWANLRLIEACRHLSDEQLDDDSTTGVYGSIRATFQHIVGAEGGYATLLGHEPDGRLRSRDPWPGWDRLTQQVREAADALVASVGESDRVVDIASENEQWDAAAILIQAVHHGTDHRSQICTILTNLGIQPPEISSWDWGFATGRGREV